MLAATLLAVGSAFLHASSNLLIKSSDDRALAAWGQFSAAALLSLAALVVVGPPGWDAAPYLLATGLVHVVYIEGLVGAYNHGDFSLSYPLARGGGAVLAAVGSVVFLGDRLPAPAWIAISIAAVGLASLRFGRTVGAAPDPVPDLLLGPSDGESVRSADSVASAFALLTAVAIATYTLVDSAGSRAGSSGVSYGFASVAAAGMGVAAANLARPSRRDRAGDLIAGWRRHLAGGLGTAVAYTMVLVAVRRAPVGYVTMLRESSVVMGALIGWLVLREGMGPRRLASSVVVLTGLILLVAVGR